jgi:hypothetical protein
LVDAMVNCWLFLNLRIIIVVYLSKLKQRQIGVLFDGLYVQINKFLASKMFVPDDLQVFNFDLDWSDSLNTAYLLRRLNISGALCKGHSQVSSGNLNCFIWPPDGTQSILVAQVA